jgi:lambda repressor-like predicted transcriptional regulator
MANEPLRHALTKAKMTPTVLADEVGVNVKAVGNWLNGTVPYPKNQYAIATALGVDPVTLWPAADKSVETATSEIVAAWPRRADCPADYWWKLIEESTAQIDILGYAILFLTEQHPDFVEFLSDRATAGCTVRIVLASPHAAVTRERDSEEGLNGGLIARINASLKYLDPFLGSGGISVRSQSVPMYNSLFRFDDEMLVTPHLYATPGRLAPMFHLRRLGAGGLFDQFMGHFEGIWQDTVVARRPG